MHRLTSVVRTAHASRYLQQLCKHWSHRFQTRVEPSSGRAVLPLGLVEFEAEEAYLKIDLIGSDVESLSGLRDVVERHLIQFAFRESLAFDWQQEEVSQE